MSLISPLKSPKTYEEQLAHLAETHGLAVPNQAHAIEILKNVNYYRLSAYGIDLLDKSTDRYVNGTTIEDLYSLYLFDCRLRSIFYPVLEFIEIRLRSLIAYHLAIKYGEECYRDRTFFQPWRSGVTDKDMFDVFNEHANEEIKRQKSKPMVAHHLEKYGGHFPIWVLVELLSLRNLSTLYSLMRREDQQAVAAQFHTTSVYVKSWFAAFVEIRNICAHYGRLYNMPLDSMPKLPTKLKQYANARLFTDCLALKDQSLWRTFVSNLSAIIDECPNINLKCIGFPDDWEKLLL